MPIRKDFLHTPTPQISRFRLITGLLIAVLYAFTFYSVLYLTREILRINSVTYENNLWVLTDAEVSFYNLFFAAIAVILGQSACLIYWFDRPKRMLRQIRRRVDIVNDQRVLNWYFLSWFSKLGFVLVFLYTCSFDGYNLFFSGEIDFYPNYNYVYALIIIVLFLQSWTTIRRVFKKGTTVKTMGTCTNHSGETRWLF